ncbi:UBP-type zinc finger domain-containing protein [Amycolatopsis carbonis]|uniref:UBP-type zinc finger domain-containing protein n=1 Tax=Amycolatopsis carbonis TaxID=715471 RepID=A0A9Y2MYH7_9PSEU|nr:UBP-type zinc finger domain-containing protein [Amycolatopsis sp. 2-15]WIX83501.1 UBP-type zinc finger domain-containing protein [Amycolatopsis sp. 2-15]
MEGVDPTVPPSGTGCADCEAASPKGWWWHLRRCAQCGHIGCCDTSPSQHASAHAASTGHPVARTFEPGEEWFWNYVEEVKYDQGPALVAPTHRPDAQPVPAPTNRLPADWETYLHR